MMPRITISLPAELIFRVQQVATVEDRTVSNTIKQLITEGLHSRHQVTVQKQPYNPNDESTYTEVSTPMTPTKPDIVIPEMFKRQEQVRQPGNMASIYGKKE